MKSSEKKPSDYVAQILQEEEERRNGAKIIQFPTTPTPMEESAWDSGNLSLLPEASTPVSGSLPMFTFLITI